MCEREREREVKLVQAPSRLSACAWLHRGVVAEQVAGLRRNKDHTNHHHVQCNTLSASKLPKFVGYTYIHTHTHTHTHMYIYIHVYTYIHTFISYTQTYVYVCICKVRFVSLRFAYCSSNCKPSRRAPRGYTVLLWAVLLHWQKQFKAIPSPLNQAS